MISLKSALAYVLLLGASSNVSAFDAKECDAYVFRTQENALWHCGEKLPGETWDKWTALYCDHTQGDSVYPFAWAAFQPDDWCKFMVNTVREQNEDHYDLVPNIGINETPGPNAYSFSTIVDWGCYMVDDDRTTASYLVNSRAGQHASDVTEQCEREKNYFDYWNLNAAIRNTKWWGEVPPKTYHPDRSYWNRCFYDASFRGTNYVPELGVEYAECTPGWHCELKGSDYALCMPNPHEDHECCVSWHAKCENIGDCCSGSECNEWGFCDPSVPQVHEDPPGICSDRSTLKEEKGLWNRCFEWESSGRGDCAPGYICTGNHVYAYCEVDESVKNECCKWKHDSTNPRPGDCCLGWHSHCHQYDTNLKCIASQCVPGREIGKLNDDSMEDVHDGLCSSVPPEASFNERIDTCTGAICGVWGDPHIITCDDLHYDCQAVGLFTLMQNHMFDIQANFVHIDTPGGGASVTNDLAIDYVKDAPNDVPTMQWSFPNFERIDPDDQVYDPKSRKIGACPVMFYLDGELVDISKVIPNDYLYGDANSPHSVKLTGWNQIDVKHTIEGENGDTYTSNTVIWIEGSGPFTQWSCIMTYFICLPGEEESEFVKSSLGLLGTPTGSTKDDWMAQDGQTLMLPSHNRGQASFDYCTENWCVGQEDSIMTYEDGLTYEDFMCSNQEYEEFDIDKCENKDDIIAACEDSAERIACQIEKCAGNPDPEKEIEDHNDLKKHDDDKEEENLVEIPDADPPDYGDCANLGSGLSAATGSGAFSMTFPSINCILGAGGTVGYDNSLSVLVGGSFTCKKGSGIEGRSVFLGDMTLEEAGCERLVATNHGSLIHPANNDVCVEVGGSVSIDATFANSKYIMHKHDDENVSCHMLYKSGCSINGENCPKSKTELEHQFVMTNGDFKQDSSLDLTRWSEEITLLQQKTDFWKTLNDNGSTEENGPALIFKAGVDNNPVQIFRINMISSDSPIKYIIFNKELLGKTILILVEGEGEFNVDGFCFHSSDSLPTDAPICGYDTFPPQLTSSIAWVFDTSNQIHLLGQSEFQGSIVVPYGDLTISTSGQSGRLIVGGDLTLDGEWTELHNYEFDPASHPLPLGDDIDEICEVQTPVCAEDYKIRTSEEICPTNANGDPIPVVTLVKSTGSVPEDEPILYDIIVEPPKDDGSHTVKFKIDNPFTNHTDIYIKHVKKVSKYAMDPVCESMPFTAGCVLEAPEIEVGCHEYSGVAPFALVNIYFASNTDSAVIAAGNDVTIDKCCKPPEEYATGYGIIEYTFEIQCECPTAATES